jgi:hypothetical protein
VAEDGVTFALDVLDHLLGNVPRLMVDVAGQSSTTKAATEWEDQSTIWYHGEQSYSTDSKSPVCVSNEQHIILQKFLDRDEALVTKSLEKAGVCNVTTAIKKLAEKFGEDRIRRPTKKGDGYFIRVRSRKPLVTS